MRIGISSFALGLLAGVLGLICWGIGAPTARAQVQLGGYFEHTLEVDYARESKEQILDASKIRLDLSSSLKESDISFRGNVNFIQYHSDVAYDLRGYLPDDVARDLEMGGVPTVIVIERSRIYVDNAFLNWEHTGLRFRAGKQQLSWGPGYSFNPTDLFHRKDIIDPTYEKEGVTAFRLDYRWGVGGDASLVVVPANDFHTTGVALRLATHLESAGYDIAVTAHRDSDTLSFDPMTIALRHQIRHALGLECSGSLLGLGTWLEGNYNVMPEEDNFVRVVGGLDYTFASGLYVFSEALLNTRGDNTVPYTVADWLANVFYGEPLGSGWAVLGARKDVTWRTTAEGYVFVSPDGSLLINPRLTISMSQNAEATIIGAFTTGRSGGAFSPGLYSILARARLYF